jgi:hypothetical protein
LRRAQRHKTIDIIVHNQRDLSDASHLLGLENVHHHPLAFLSETDIDAIAGQAKHQRFPLIEPFRDACKLIGVFGFLNNYKGF